MIEIDISFDPAWESRSYIPRGMIIAHFSNFEKMLDSFLSAEFGVGPDKRNKLKSVILDRMTFESKRTAVKTILNDRPVRDGFVKTNRNSHPYKTILEELNSLNTIRNQFAHYPTAQATNSFQYSNVIGLVEFRDKPKTIWFTQLQIDDIIKRISLAQAEINKLAISKNA